MILAVGGLSLPEVRMRDKYDTPTARISPSARPISQTPADLHANVTPPTDPSPQSPLEPALSEASRASPPSPVSPRTGTSGDVICVESSSFSPTVQPELFWVSDVASPLAESAESMADARGLTFVQSIDEDAPPVLGHERSLREAVSSCLDNALKYTPRGGAVGLWAGSSPDGTDTVDVVIWDTGPGVSPADQDHVWEKGQRGDAGLQSNSSGGTGLGMYIARNLVARQRGTIVLQSPVSQETLSEYLRDRTTAVTSVGPGALIRISLRRPSRG
jgi:hypothetical protein